MASIQEEAAWLRANADKKGTPEFTAHADSFRALQAAPGGNAPLEVRPSGGEPTPKPLQPFEQINIDAPIEQFRKDVAALPDEQQRVFAMQRWADKQEAQIAPTRGYIGPMMRSIAQGTPIGTYGDEVNAWVNDKLPAALGGRPYDETLALERARDRRVEKENFWPDMAGNVIGGIATAPVRGAVAAKDAVLSGIQGFGRGDGIGERLGNAAMQAGASGAMSLLGRGVGNIYNRWTRQAPEIAEAGQRIGMDTPFYVRAEDRGVQVAGRQAAQGNNTAATSAWDTLSTDMNQSIGNTVRRETGVDPAYAPAAVGANAREGFSQAAQGAGDASGTLARQTSNIMPQDFASSPLHMRDELGRVIGERAAARELNPERGLGDIMNLTTHPEGVTWPGMSKAMTNLGAEIRRPDMFVPREVPAADLTKIYQAGRYTDQPNMIREALSPRPYTPTPGARAGVSTNPGGGPWGAGNAVRQFEANLPQQQALHEFQREIQAAIGSKNPEQLVTLVANAAQVGGGKAGNQEMLNILAQSLPPQMREQVGAAVLAHISNQARNPKTGGTGYANLLNALGNIPPQTRAQLFGTGQLGRDVNDTITMAQRLHGIETTKHVGSAATLGEPAKGLSPLLAPAVATSVGAGANYMGLSPELSMGIGALGLARGGGKYLAAKARPRLLEHGLPGPAVSPAVEQYASRAWGGASRAVPNEWWAQP